MKVAKYLYKPNLHHLVDIQIGLKHKQAHSDTFL